jgi:hypothetical protein
MERAKAFFLICAGILMLAVAFDLWVGDAQADETGSRGEVVSVFNWSYNWWAITNVGDVYFGESLTAGNWEWKCNILEGGVATENTDWSKLKTNFGK